MSKKKKNNSPQFIFCLASNPSRVVYKTLEEVKLRLEKDKGKHSLYPLSAFFCLSCNCWHITRHPVIDGEEIIDEKVLAWEQKMSQAKKLSVSISSILSNATFSIEKGEYIIARRLLSDARVKIDQLRSIKDGKNIKELEKRTENIEKYLINTSKLDNKYEIPPFVLLRTRKKGKTLNEFDELTPKIVQKIDNMIEETEGLTKTNNKRAYKLMRECHSLIDKIKYGNKLKELKHQWMDRLNYIKEELAKRG